jgi:hypothetical protein
MPPFGLNLFAARRHLQRTGERTTFPARSAARSGVLQTRDRYDL